MGSAAIPVHWPGFLIQWDGRLTSVVRWGCEFASLTWCGLRIVSVAGMAYWLSRPNQAEQPPGFSSHTEPPGLFCRCAEPLAQISVGYSCKQEGSPPGSECWEMEGCPFFLSIWCPVVKPCRFTWWSPWNKTCMDLQKCFSTLGELDVHVGLSFSVGESPIDAALFWLGREVVW